MGDAAMPMLVKFPLGGNTGSGLGGSVWAKEPSPLKNPREGKLLGVTTSTETGVTYIYATGYIGATKENWTAVLVKYDADGNLIWSKTLGNTTKRSKSAGTSVEVLGSSIYVGGFAGAAGSGTEFVDIAVFPSIWKYDSVGNQVWQKSDTTQLYKPATTDSEIKVDLVGSDDFLYLASGQLATDQKGGDVLILKYTEAGSLVWKVGRGTGAPTGMWYGWASGIAAGTDRLYVVGQAEKVGSSSVAKSIDAFMLEVDKEYGSMLASHSWDAGSDRDEALDVAVSGADVYMTGFKTVSANKDLLILRYTPLDVQTVALDILPDVKGFMNGSGESTGSGLHK